MESVSPVWLSKKEIKQNNNNKKNKKTKNKEDYEMFLLLKTITNDFLPRSTSVEKPEALWGVHGAKWSTNGASFMFCSKHTQTTQLLEPAEETANGSLACLTDLFKSGVTAYRSDTTYPSFRGLQSQNDFGYEFFPFSTGGN